jgi:hypothetical protein
MSDLPDRLDTEDAAPEPDVPPVTAPVTAPPQGMLPAREHRRLSAERGLMRLVATCGIVAIGTAIAAIMGSQDVDGWIIGLVVSVVSVVLAALLWSSREL